MKEDEPTILESIDEVICRTSPEMMDRYQRLREDYQRKVRQLRREFCANVQALLDRYSCPDC